MCRIKTSLRQMPEAGGPELPGYTGLIFMSRVYKKGHKKRSTQTPSNLCIPLFYSTRDTKPLMFKQYSSKVSVMQYMLVFVSRKSSQSAKN